MTKNDKAAIENGFFLDVQRAERVREFFRRFIRHSTGRWAGQPFELLPWQYEGIVLPLFGWANAEGMRRYRTAYISTPKKNGKTTLLAGLCLDLMIADGEPAAEVYSAAADREQASLIYREAMKMVQASPELSAHVFVRESTKILTGPGGSRYRALSADAHRQEGLNASAILFDELHAQPGRELWDCLRYAGAARTQPLHLSITTAGGDLQTICGEQYQYAKRVLSDDVIDPTFFAYIAEAANEDDWSLESTWKKSNPSYGVTIDPAAFRADFNEAKDSPAKENSFRRYRLNQWIQAADAWLSMQQWDDCKADFNEASLAGQPCYAGLDLSATDDTTALVLLFPTDGGAKLLSWFWLPAENIGALERKHKVPYQAWAKQDLFRLTSGNVVDYRELRKDVNEIGQRFNIKALVIDRKFQGQQLETELIEDGFTVFAAGQGWMSQDLPAKEIERLLKASRLWHNGHPVMRWHASNVVVDIDKNGNYSLNKRKSRSKIDGMAALVNAMQPALKSIVGPSVYEDRGITVI